MVKLPSQEGKKKKGLKRLRYLLRSIIDVGMEAMH